MNKEPLSKRENVASVIMTIVLTQTVKYQRATVPLSAVYEGVPQKDLNWLKSGISALKDLHMLGMDGNDIGVTDGGKAYLNFMMMFSNPPDTQEARDALETPSPKLDAIRASISRDVRFDPPPSAAVAELPTVPAALAEGKKSMWNFWMVAFVVFMIYCLGTFLYQAGKASG